ncbi:Thioredoxin-like [2Fe-2S] ferredoxin [Dethiosulfatibacter aminovorans DSM 17477]|uniref:Thioredoxin-like [2Fe-2S] ferredoxin n=1 Tax=Dethiosulfatibacter aminovorans DSM 17477 TaxID=1121476 RepID=A0A1M6I1G2_9FIRM|nr:(2Fe-2S) ferredoxin domain-containing protein [Dethiosulfatibacter aminovorans]SHJ28094.1 Thioredoxin-like [2Fe-2S] ferredoxin [Dethiosulfatibacter aminovorans DSM 17477]
MNEIFVCVGSACHLKGSYDVIDCFKNWIKDNELQDDFVVKASFCLGHCTDAVSVKLGEEIYSVSPDSVEEFINQNIAWSRQL